MKNVYFAATIALMAATALVGCTKSPAPAGKAPVIFVNGYREDDGTMWDPAVAYFKANGYNDSDLSRYNYKTAGPGALTVEDAAKGLADKVDQVRKATGKPRVDIVAHSLGDLVTKECIVEGGCKFKVAHWANYAGAQNGTEIAKPDVCPDPACAQMLPATSQIIPRLQKAYTGQLFLQRFEVQVHWSPNDGVIIPDPSVSKEPFADVIKVDGSIDHLHISSDPGVLADTVKFFSK